MARIILVDDDPVIGHLAASALFDAGHAVGWIADGRDALGVMQARAPHLAILDCAMPGMSGVELLRMMRADGDLCHVPVLMLTSRRSQADEALALSAGADDYLRKPADLDQLVGRVDALLFQDGAARSIRTA